MKPILSEEQIQEKILDIEWQARDLFDKRLDGQISKEEYNTRVESLKDKWEELKQSTS